MGLILEILRSIAQQETRPGACPGRRFYFLDPDGIEYEIISYR
ncbi:MAG TPA: hypothetical protein VFO09_02990 [Methyloceanibacter sp.]|nr:hypothetical protein [Methyloceanibacter sp.]